MVTGFVRASWTIVAAAWLLLLAGCADFPEALSPAAPYSCLLPAEQHMLVAELFFGRGINGRQPLTDAEWAEFAAQTITPNFPDGFTVLDGEGQWRNPQNGQIAGGRTKILLVAVKPNPDLARRLSAVTEAYKARFHQQSVGIITRELLCGVLGAMHPRPRRTQPFAYPATLTAARDSCPMTS